jgi:uncharacterized membrane protein
MAITLYLHAFHGLLGLAFGPERQLWLALALNTTALGAWEAGARAGIGWLQERWAMRLMASACAAIATALALVAIFDSGWGIAGWLAWMAVSYAVYRHAVKDLYVLAVDALSLIAVTVAFLGKHLKWHDAAEYLLIGVVVIGLSAAAGYWLRRVAQELDA